MTLLYHVTLGTNVQSILKSGIDPVYSSGKTDQCWFVDGARILWALAHCSARHNVPVSQLVVFTVELGAIRRLRRNRYPGIYSSPCRVKSQTFASAMKYVQPESAE